MLRAIQAVPAGVEVQMTINQAPIRAALVRQAKVMPAVIRRRLPLQMGEAMAAEAGVLVPLGATPQVARQVVLGVRVS